MLTVMQAVFVELPAFERSRESYLDDGGFGRLREALMASPEAAEVIPGTGGLRKVRFRKTRWRI